MHAQVIVLAMHGAELTNIVFLRPCSVQCGCGDVSIRLFYSQLLPTPNLCHGGLGMVITQDYLSKKTPKLDAGMWGLVTLSYLTRHDYHVCCPTYNNIVRSVWTSNKHDVYSHRIPCI